MSTVTGDGIVIKKKAFANLKIRIGSLSSVFLLPLCPFRHRPHQSVTRDSLGSGIMESGGPGRDPSVSTRPVHDAGQVGFTALCPVSSSVTRGEQQIPLSGLMQRVRWDCGVPGQRDPQSSSARTWALVVFVANVVCPFEVYCSVELGVILEVEDVFV